MKKILKPVLSIMLLSSMFMIPVFATNVYVQDFSIPMLQGWNSKAIDSDCYGGYLYLTLTTTGDVKDEIDFRGQGANGTITTTSSVIEGGGKGSVRFTDGKDTAGRVLKSVQMRSHNFNAGGYTVNGTIVY